MTTATMVAAKRETLRGTGDTSTRVQRVGQNVCLHAARSTPHRHSVFSFSLIHASTRTLTLSLSFSFVLVLALTLSLSLSLFFCLFYTHDVVWTTTTSRPGVLSSRSRSRARDGRHGLTSDFATTVTSDGAVVVSHVRRAARQLGRIISAMSSGTR